MLIVKMCKPIFRCISSLHIAICVSQQGKKFMSRNSSFSFCNECAIDPLQVCNNFIRHGFPWSGSSMHCPYYLSFKINGYWCKLSTGIHSHNCVFEHTMVSLKANNIWITLHCCISSIMMLFKIYHLKMTLWNRYKFTI